MRFLFILRESLEKEKVWKWTEGLTEIQFVGDDLTIG